MAESTKTISLTKKNDTGFTSRLDMKTERMLSENRRADYWRAEGTKDKKQNSIFIEKPLRSLAFIGHCSETGPCPRFN